MNRDGSWSVCLMLQKVLFERIEKEPDSTCPYKRLFLDYAFGLDRICTEGEIRAAKASFDLNENTI